MSAEIQARSAGKEIAKGIASCFALNLLHLGGAWLLLWYIGNSDFFFAIGYWLIAWFGLLQFIYVFPFVFVLRKKGRSNVAKGMLIAAAINFLLSAACWGSISFVTGQAPWKF